ncbi:hypothetical protein B9Q06_05755 [Candidatus Marsarchaeota G2 archaeon ECH_B_2]|uniref:HTH marR-type domain-containing protein n=3 Tax=Candidatus Marsarchaeota group 2 TaxID=2203771 RepID=A0A2R6BA23_9ARCH|nr:MAG: hypothetical protein B9Q06_11325 [Candidatus Marsarchaeota G2 archaeon ECH_B_2]PSN95524.1 MAG: hypothetical protein B9Q06_05755 [Candidatus Marsarchaeota G2 archaeon ECH_B_2]PSN97648.1 MAG: hypothetical protein B9Q07_11705 [Candidatus Marsarchaeota G2 archaeon ECH_B_3]PSO02336.1 MAG: hypothetical protein B9Q05_05645 [Candidatus Marsarchaeota G2 archaeon ECH_B_1]
MEGGEEDTLRIINLVSKLSSTMRKEISRELKRVGLKSVDFAVLKTLSRGGVTPKKLADRFGLTKPAITYTVDRLEEHGLVRRERNTSDRRRVIVTLTKKGRRVLARAEHLYLRSLQNRLGALNQQELISLEHTLEKLINLFLTDKEHPRVNSAYS